MIPTRTGCTDCFAPGTRPDCRTHDGSAGALIHYATLHRSGHLAFMCQKADRQFRVCHEAGGAPRPG